jgi:hypothetical protein
MTSPDWQAEESLVATDSDGREVSLTIRIGTPVRVGPTEWYCRIAVDGLVDELKPARGASSLQALCLATTLARRLLEAFVARGGTLAYSGAREAFDIQATFSGIGEPA